MPDVEPAVLERLLGLQDEDSAIARLRHQKETLPEAQGLAEISDQLAELDADLEIAVKQDDEIGREQARLEGEIGLLEQKIGREEQRMYSGAVSNPKELSALRAEVESLKRKRAGLEDELLEIMVNKEQAAATLESLRAERTGVGEQHSSLAETVRSLTTEIDAELAQHEGRRGEIVGDVPDDLLKLYERLREQKGGIGAAALRNGTCEGCHTKLPAKEVERLRAEGGLQRCDNCRRILVIV